MSNDIVGVLYVRSDSTSAVDLLNSVAAESVLGVTVVAVDEAQSRLVPHPVAVHTGSAGFIVADRKGGSNASYLIDGTDYVSDAKIGLPLRSSDRLQLLFDLLSGILASPALAQVSIALMDCGQIEEVKATTPSAMEETIRHDMLEYSPPDTLYIIVPEEEGVQAT